MVSTDFTGGPPPPPPAPPQHNLPPGFRFHPTDEELVVHYLKRKADSSPLPVAIIADVDLYKFDPWELPAKASFGEREWYFFSPRDRKYPNGVRPNRSASSGYWKATGTDKPVISTGGGKVGVKKALVFYSGKPPKGVKSDWIMHEYRLSDNNNNKLTHICDFGNKKNSLRLDDWVLCRIYKKNNTITSRHHHHHHQHHQHHDMMMINDDLYRHNPLTISGLHSRTNFLPTVFSDNNYPTVVYDGGGNYSMNQNLASLSVMKPDELLPPMMLMPTSLIQEPVIRSLSSPSKKFNGGVGDCSMAAPPLLQPQGGVLGEEFIRTSYQLSGLNWYA